VRGDLTTSLRSSAVGEALALPCLAGPRCGAASTGSLPPLVGDECRFLGIYNIVVLAVAFIFFLQVGLQPALHRSRAAADKPTTPWFAAGRRSLILRLCGAGRAAGAGIPLVQSIDSGAGVLPCPRWRGSVYGRRIYSGARGGTALPFGEGNCPR
jgi:hypothetical protein